MTLDSFEEIDQFTYLHSWLDEQPEREEFSMTVNEEYLISWRLRTGMVKTNFILWFDKLQSIQFEILLDFS